MAHLSQLHARRVIASGVMSYNAEKIRAMYVTLWKWELMRLRNLEAILFADLDIDLLPDATQAAAVAAEWAVRVPQLLLELHEGTRADDEGVSYVGYGDVTTPLNTGLFWLLPPKTVELYHLGLDVLRASWNWSHGWNVSGTPQQLWPPAAAAASSRRHSGGRRHAAASHAAAGHTASSGHDVLPVSLWHFGAGWDRIDYGDLDQGFFLYMLHHKRSVAHSLRGGAVHHVMHFVSGPQKPWRRALEHRPQQSSCSWDNLIRHAYLRSAGMPLSTAGSACAAAFRGVLGSLDEAFAGDEAAACCATFGDRAPDSRGGHVRLSVF